MRRVTGIGGIFMTAKDPKALSDWYKTHLGIDVQPWGGAAFDWTDAEGKPTGGTTAWSIGPADGKHFAPSTSTFMVNYRVEDLEGTSQSTARGRLQRARQDRRLGVRKVRLGHGSGGQQGRALATATGAVKVVTRTSRANYRRASLLRAKVLHVVRDQHGSNHDCMRRDQDVKVSNGRPAFGQFRADSSKLDSRSVFEWRDRDVRGKRINQLMQS
jgi:hypothetical protein